jgi:DNA-binding CsgD family transcriptional regulator
MVYGRDRELRMLTGLLDDAQAGRGGALVVRGVAGCGKSALLEFASQSAMERGMRLIGTAGFRAEAGVPYAALSRVLRAEVGPATLPHRAALLALDSVTSCPPGEAVLVVVEDAQWLDRPSWDALAFIGRRFRSDPVLALIAMRDGAETERRLSNAGLLELPLGPLADAAPGALLDGVAPGLAQAERERIVAEAKGNPWALTELAAGPAPSPKAQRVFAAMVAELPAATGVLLEVAAFGDGDSLDELLAAGSLLQGMQLRPGDVEPAVAAGIVSVDDGFRLRWLHPLARLAVRKNSGVQRRRQVHTALADSLVHDPDREVWHRAATAPGPDEAMAQRLAEAAGRLRTRNPDLARAALERSAQLTPAPGPRASRLLAALEVAEQEGDREALARIVSGLDPVVLSPVERARLSWIKEVSLAAHSSGGAWVASLAPVAAALSREGEAERALESMLSLAVRLYISNLDDGARADFAATVASLDVPVFDARRLCILAAVDPVRWGGHIEKTLHELIRSQDSPARQLGLLGSAATGIGAFPMGVNFFAAAAAGLRPQGRLGTLSWVLVGQGITAGLLGDARLATAAATEARVVAEEAGQTMQAMLADLALAFADALRGNGSEALERTRRCERVLQSSGAQVMQATVDLVLGVAALADGRVEEAFGHCARVVRNPRTAQPHLRFAALGPYAEAAARCGRLPELRSIVDEWEPLAQSGCAPVLAVNLAYARAVLAPDERAEGVFEQALAADLSEWPFERARLQLAYGTWMRRKRHSARSRPVLRDAARIFDALGAAAWMRQAERELRASGESPQRSPDAREQLTAQEMQVAQLAAAGLSNREIAERLFLSPRTVTTHLSRIFPKLGITSRRELPAVMKQHPNT